MPLFVKEPTAKIYAEISLQEKDTGRQAILAIACPTSKFSSFDYLEFCSKFFMKEILLRH